MGTLLRDLDKAAKNEVAEAFDALKTVAEGLSISMGELLELLTQQMSATQRGRPPGSGIKIKLPALSSEQVARRTLAQAQFRHTVDELAESAQRLQETLVAEGYAEQERDIADDEVVTVDRMAFDPEKKEFVVKQQVSGAGLAHKTLERMGRKVAHKRN